MVARPFVMYCPAKCLIFHPATNFIALMSWVSGICAMNAPLQAPCVLYRVFDIPSCAAAVS